MENARLDYLTSQASFDKAQADVDDTVITAPMDGYIIGEPMEVGETVSQGLSSQMIIATVADLSSMQIKLLVDETDIGEVSKGETVTFTVDAYPNREFHGTVREYFKKRIFQFLLIVFVLQFLLIFFQLCGVLYSICGYQQ